MPGLGGGAETHEEAEQQAVEAIAFTLESDEEVNSPAGGEVGYLRVTVER